MIYVHCLFSSPPVAFSFSFFISEWSEDRCKVQANRPHSSHGYNSRETATDRNSRARAQEAARVSISPARAVRTSIVIVPGSFFLYATGAPPRRFTFRLCSSRPMTLLHFQDLAGQAWGVGNPRPHHQRKESVTSFLLREVIIADIPNAISPPTWPCYRY